MSHRCGANCRRKQTPSQRPGCPSCGSRRQLPASITAGGKTRWLTKHAQERVHEGVTEQRIKHVLENWVVRGICRAESNREAIVYWGFVPGRKGMLRVPVSLDDEEIITATFDEGAARRVGQEGQPWFRRRCRDLEVRDAG